MPGPIFIQARGETGLDTLIGAGQLPETPSFPECMNWTDLRGSIAELTETDHSYKTLVIDTLNGVERLCFEHVCAREYNNEWGEKGFAAFGRGPETSMSEWRFFLSDLDTLRSTKKMAIFALCHTKVKNFKNPEGPDYERYQPDLHEKTWSLTHKWADLVLFSNFETTVSDDKGKRAKGTGGRHRLLYTQRCAAYDAKNRHGLPEEIDLSGGVSEGFANFKAAMAAGRKIEKAGE